MNGWVILDDLLRLLNLRAQPPITQRSVEREFGWGLRPVTRSRFAGLLLPMASVLAQRHGFGPALEHLTSLQCADGTTEEFPLTCTCGAAITTAMTSAMDVQRHLKEDCHQGSSSFGMQCWKCRLLFPTVEEGIAHERACGSLRSQTMPPQGGIQVRRNAKGGRNKKGPPVYWLCMNFEKNGSCRSGSIILNPQTIELEWWCLMCLLTYRSNSCSTICIPPLAAISKFPLRKVDKKHGQITHRPSQPECYISATDAITLCNDLEHPVVATAIAQWASQVGTRTLGARVNCGVCLELVSRETYIRDHFRKKCYGKVDSYMACNPDAANGDTSVIAGDIRAAAYVTKKKWAGSDNSIYNPSVTYECMNCGQVFPAGFFWDRHRRSQGQ
ncbi:hypothetical protein K491DRAFT_683108 [Lophiostoma macrostomum CBS 122681]|uniref:Uncharacterized protein n=1 Tax=Lophiostoma macrostomum CBS 122681 TaxID=1314788 RepID=A0A6A6SUS0_9PLEO|nr:hypothetical protein K491DRAFT_683108 [Lophiostoma macrostomum CBS 122681]